MVDINSIARAIARATDSMEATGGADCSQTISPLELNDFLQRTPQNPRAKSLASKDAEGIALLRQIFPDLPEQELWNLHKNHVQKSSKKPYTSEQNGPSSRLGQRIWKQAKWLQEQSVGECEALYWRPTELADDFLRLPLDVAIRRHNPRENKWHYIFILPLEKQVLEQHVSRQKSIGAAIDYPVDELNYTRVIFRDPQKGLGMTLCEERGRIWVHSLIDRDGSRWFVSPPEHENEGPAMKAGIVPGDWLLGINGQALLPLPSSSEDNKLLKDAVSIIQYSPDPVILHFLRVPPHRLHPLVERNRQAPSISLNGPSLLDLSLETVSGTSISSSRSMSNHVNNPVNIHPFVAILASKNLIQSMKDQVEATRRLSTFTDRARQWESFSSFRLDAHSLELKPNFDPKDLPPSMSADILPFQCMQVNSVRPWAPSTPTLDPAIDIIPFSMARNDEWVTSFDDEEYDQDGPRSLLSGKPIDFDERIHLTRFAAKPHPRRRPGNTHRGTKKGTSIVNDDEDIIFIPLMNVRKALCCRILNTFMDNNRTAYTIWVYDVESGREWYAPVRYMRDFHQLRSSTVPLCSSLNHLPFPSMKWNIFGNSEKSEPAASKEARSRQLESFLRTLCYIIYTDPLHSSITEIAIHVQSFLGCDAGLGSEDLDLHLQNHVTLNEPMGSEQGSEEGHSELQMKVRFYLKSSIQRYTFRLFLLDVVEKIIRQFVDETRAKGPTFHEIEALEANGRSVIKERGMMDLERIQAFLDQMQTLILDGCMADFESISRRREFFPLHKFFEGLNGKLYLERVAREAVREQLEIEIYVPLRTMVSRYLVHGWRHDDMEMHFKVNELRKRPQAMFRIPKEKQSPSEWRSVSCILNEGAQQSTLPCGKLRSIVHAAKEISRIYAEEHRSNKVANGEDSSPLGADDFLPIFIYCVVKAGVERPCALTVLLRTLCEPTNRIGEIGYYLASFEAAITHIQEMDLTDDLPTRGNGRAQIL